MANVYSPFFSFHYNGDPGHYDAPFEEELASKSMDDPLASMEVSGHVSPIYGPGYYDLQMIKQPQLTLDMYFGSCFPAPAQSVPAKTEPDKAFQPRKEVLPIPSSLDLLNSYRGGSKKISFEPPSKKDASRESKKLSTEEIMKVAGARFIQFSDQRYELDYSIPGHPFDHSMAGLSEEESKDVELAYLLLAAAEKVGYQQFEAANRLLNCCESFASVKANPVQRVVYHFADALRARIDKASGKFTEEEVTCVNPHGLGTNLSTLILYQSVPMFQALQFTAIQAIIENVGAARKLHVIDFSIRSGVQWTSLMQALAGREQHPLKHLKITAVAFTSTQSAYVDDTGKSLECFAKAMNFPFSFNAVKVSCINDVNESLFETKPDEQVVVVCHTILRIMISVPGCIENLMRVIKNLNPTIMMVSEVEANLNIPTFVTRFIESLFFYSAYFDCVETCMNQDVQNRNITEEVFGHGIRHIVAVEGSERIGRSVKLDVWRTFFARFRMMEIGVSASSSYLAELLLKQHPYGNLCTLERNGKGLTVGWKGTPLHSLSAWKFPRDRLGRLSNHRS